MRKVSGLVCIFIFLLFCIPFLFGSKIFAQSRCATVQAEQNRRSKYSFLPSPGDFEDWISQKLKERKNKPIPFGTKGTGNPDKIAVVVHVIYNAGDAYGEGTNISNEQIYSQLEVLNEDYQRNNADTILTQPDFLDIAAGMNIEFVLARQTLEGGPTTGIVRIQGPKNSYNPLSIADRELLSGLSNWDPDVYLNIWVVNLGSSYIGLAQFPDYSYPGLDGEPNRDNAATDGLLIDHQAFGSSEKVPGLDLLSTYGLGRTTTHEMGHFFGLKHLWGDDYSNCTKDDYVDDTPNSINDYSGQTTPIDHVSCGSNDMYENYLNYTNDQGMNAFTEMQVVRMETVIENAPRRKSLYNSLGTEYPDNMYYDLAINAIKSPGKVECGNDQDIKIEVKNNGTIPVKNFDLTYAINNNEKSYRYSGDTIFTAQTIQIDLEKIGLNTGTYKLFVALADNPSDINSSNDSKTLVFAVDDQADFIPLREKFESPILSATDWISINEDNKIGWELVETPTSGHQQTAAFINLYNYEDTKQQDWLISPRLDFSDAEAASLTFKTSYAKNAGFNDQFRILASKNCGVDFDEFLAVYTANELANDNSTDYWEPQNQADWTKRTIDLGEYAGEPNMRIAFVTNNEFGNNLYLDDIEFYTTASENLVSTGENSFTVYPNPSFDGQFKLAFNTSERQDVRIFIYDRLGQLVSGQFFPNTLNQTYHYDLFGLRSGLYVIVAKGTGFVRSKKLLITR